MKTLKTFILLTASIFYFIGLQAQTGPGGIGNSTGNNGQPNNRLWFDASALTLMHADKVSQWNDRSGNALHALQPTAGNQPTFYNSGSYAFPVVSFDAASQDFMPFDGMQIVGTDYTVVLVAQRRTTSSRVYFFGGTDAGGNMNFHVFWDNATSFNTNHYGNDLSTALINTAETYSGGTTQSTFGIFTTRLASLETDPYRKNFQNNAYLSKTHGNNAKLTNWEGAAMARAAFDNSPVYSNVDIAEMIVFSTALNQAQIEILNNYLSEKYSIVIDNDIFSAPADFKFDVAGIGNRNNAKHSTAASAGVYLSERDNTLSDGEFVFFAHHAIANSIANINRTAVVTNGTLAQAAWGREWFFKPIGATSAQVQLIFNFEEAFENGKFPTNLENYILLRRSSTSADYQEVPFSQSDYRSVNEIYFNVNETDFTEGYYTLATKDEANSPLQGVSSRTWYALKSGKWSEWETWTLDPSGNLPNNPAHELPSDNPVDKVVIHSGKTVTVDMPDAINSSLKIEGRIDFGSTTGHQFDVIKGNGRILLAADNFPQGDASDFYTKGMGEGTVILYGGNYILATQHEFFNLEMELTNDFDTLILTKNYTINGNFDIKKGVFEINDHSTITPLNIIVKGNLTIDALGEIRTGRGRTIGAYSILSNNMPTSGNYHKIYHQLELWGNFTNNGIARFTNQIAPIYNEFAPHGVSVYFKGNSNNTAILNGQTDFYNLIIDKGIDQTYMLEIYSANVNNFKLFGANNAGFNTSLPFSSQDPEVRKALWIHHGTLKLTGLMNIPTLSEGSITGGSGDYYIGKAAQLWIAGNINMHVTATDNSTTANTQVDNASGASVTPGTGNQAMSVLGKFRISDGYFSTRNSAGFIFWSSSDAQVHIEGGEVRASQMRNANSALGQASYRQTGGSMYIEGNNFSGEVDFSRPLFGLEDPESVFIMLGGEIIIQDSDGDPTPEYFIASTAGNYLVTGGTLHFELPNAATAQIYSIADVWNLELENTNATGNFTLQAENELTISNHLTIANYTTLSCESSASVTYNLNVGGNFTLAENGVYDHANNITRFVGNKDSYLYAQKITARSPLVFYNLEIEKTQKINPQEFYAVILANNGRTEDIDDLKNFAVKVLNYFTITRGAYDMFRYKTELRGNLKLIDGEFRTDGGRLVLNSFSQQQTIEGSKAKEQDFGHLEINNTSGSGILLLSDLNVTQLSMVTSSVACIFDMSIYNLTVTESIHLTGDAWSANKMFKTSGLTSDGGLTHYIAAGTYADQLAVTFPFGTTTNYTPAEMFINGAVTDDGLVTMKPVNSYHPTTTDEDKVIKYYWKVDTLGLTDLLPEEVKYTFEYFASIPSNQNKACAFSENDWTEFNETSVDNKIIFPYTESPTGATPIVTDFTVGNKSAFTKPQTLYSKTSGLLSAKATWTESSTHSGSNATKINDFDIFIIGGVAGTNHTVTVDADDSKASKIYIKGNSETGNTGNPPTLVINAATTGHIFNEITGKGRIILNDGTLPNADYGDFINNTEAIFEYNGADYTLPTGLSKYPNLQIRGNAAGRIKTAPDIDLIINGNLQINDPDYTGITFVLNTASVGNIDVYGNLVLENQSKFLLPANGTKKTVIVEKNILLNNASVSSIEVEDGISGEEPHVLNVFGNIEVNSSLITLWRAADKRTVDLYFSGETDSYIYDAPANSVFNIKLNRLINNKLITKNIFFNEEFSLNAATNLSAKALEISSGNLIIDNANTNIVLTSGGGDFSIPSECLLELRQGTLTISGDNTGLQLDGKLAVKGGNAYFNGTGNGYNCIEYSASGTSEIELTAGNLIVGGQIRRATNSEEGILTYTQTGGSLQVGTKYPLENTRGVFEILNNGSQFTFTGGSFVVAQSQPNPSIAAFYFAPQTAVFVSGVTIQFGSSNTLAARNNFKIYASKNLESVELNNVSNTNPKLYISILPLSLNKNLTIAANTEFNAAGFQLNIAGNLINNGTFTASGNTTVFNGTAAQSIEGSSETTFYRFIKNNINTLTLNHSIRVNNEFRLESGILNDNSFTLYLKGNVYNTATHQHGGSGDGIALVGTSEQYISGSGTYGKLTTNNHEGIVLNTGYNIIITNMLKMVDGVFNIGSNLLTIGEFGTIFPERPFSTQNMIQTNISFTDNGVKKIFPQNVTGTFTYPIGAGGKYTPVVVTANSNPDAGGYLIAKAANEIHASIQEDTEAPDNIEIPDRQNALQYYWSLSAHNFTNVSGNVEFFYTRSDVMATNGYDSTYYIPARLLENSTLWNKYDWTDFDENLGKIVFRFTDVGSAQISGDYTAGVQPNSGLLKGAIPVNVAVYQTVASGDWTDENIWSPTIQGGPRGAIIIINSEHTVRADLNYLLAHQIEINGTLNTENTFGNRLGLVSGTGTLSTESGLLPAGFYNKFFFAKNGGTLQYKGTTGYDALNNLSEVNNVRFSGTGDRRLPNLELKLLGSLWIDGTDTDLEVINEHNTKLTVCGDVIMTNGSFDAGIGAGAIFELGGTELQTVQGNFTGLNAFNHLTINNLAGVNLNSTIEVDYNLTFTNGIVKVSGAGNTLKLNSLSNNVVIGANCSRYVNGTVSKLINDNDSFVFPVGKNTHCGFIEVFNTATTAAQYWQAEYFDQSADNAGFNTSSMVLPLTYVSKSEYWRVNCDENTVSADLKLNWTDYSGLPNDEASQNDQRIVEWTDLVADAWKSVSIEDGVNHAAKTISSTTPAIGFRKWTEGNYFTFGTMGVLPVMTWQGDVSEAWEEPFNWDTGTIPYSAADVIIPNVKNIDINYNFPRISSAASCKALTIDQNASLIINSAYTLQAGGNTTIDGTFALACQYYDVAQFIDNGTIITGATADVRAYRWVPGDKYSYISSPLTAAIRDEFNNDFGTNPNFYWYDEANNDAIDWMDGWKFGHSILEVARGYASGWPGAANHLKFQGGTFNTGNISIAVTNSAQSETSDGWNLIGNPYPSAIDAEEFINANSSVINGALYFWDDDGTLGSNYSSGDYATWNLAGSLSGQSAPSGGGTNKIPNGYIGMAQGFFVYSPFGGSLSFTNTMRTFGNGQFFNTKRSTKNNFQKIYLSMYSQKHYNEALIAFSDEASDGFDTFFDALKIKGNTHLAFFSLLKGQAYSIQSLNALPSNDSYKAIELGYTASTECEYIIELKQMENIEKTEFIYLDDRQAKVLTDLQTDSLYQFLAKAETNESRFRLIFSNKELSYNEIESENSLLIYSWKKNLTVEIKSGTSSKGIIEISNLSGQILKTLDFENDYYFDIPLNVQSGIYLVKVINNGILTTQKVYFND